MPLGHFDARITPTAIPHTIMHAFVDCWIAPNPPWLFHPRLIGSVVYSMPIDYWINTQPAATDNMMLAYLHT
jgi:hypothetical protein